MTSTYITTTTALRVESALGDHAGDYDVEGLRQAWRDQLMENMPRGIYLALNGEVTAELDAADDARDIEWDNLESDPTVIELFWQLAEKYDRAAALEAAGASFR